MTRESRIYAKEQQIKTIDNILCSLCSLELTADGRKYLKKMKAKIAAELEHLKNLETDETKVEPVVSFKGFRLKLPESLKTSW